MELKQLEAFVNVAELKSFSLAAKKLYLTQPTISAHIKCLEDELGTLLFDRTTKSLGLTPAGEKMFSYAQRMISIKTAMLENLSETSAPLVIGASSVPSAYLLPKALCSFHSLFPDTPLELRHGDSSEVEQMVADGAVRLGVTGRPPVAAGLLSEILCRDTMVFITPASEEYRELLSPDSYQASGHDCSAASVMGKTDISVSGKTGISASGKTDISASGRFEASVSDSKHMQILRRLLYSPVILRSEGSGTKAASEEILKDCQPASGLKIAAVCSDQEAIKSMVACGMGISIASLYAVEDAVASGKLLSYPIYTDPEEETATGRYFRVIYRKIDKPDGPAKAFIKLLQESISR